AEAQPPAPAAPAAKAPEAPAPRVATKEAAKPSAPEAPKPPASKAAPPKAEAPKVATRPAAKAEPSPEPSPRTQEPAAAKPPLDVKSLEQRLKETDAIGVMTKLSLKNQVDDLLEQFRDYYAGRSRATLAELRRPFELLLMKVLSLLQDRDPALAKAIHDSRDALWAILADRARFEKLT
ncbi:MAG TPA: hypothetical protein VLS49_15460, partial [Usitatibacter sp.]|nr:hypothetical protein [Usitatibacter sp.]